MVLVMGVLFMLLAPALATPAYAQGGPPVVFTGNVPMDFPAGSAFLYDPGLSPPANPPEWDVSMPNTWPLEQQVSGWDMEYLAFFYDGPSDVMYVGIQYFDAGTVFEFLGGAVTHTLISDVIAGDADHDGDPGGASTYLQASGGVDMPDIGNGEAIVLIIDTNLDGAGDAIVGVPQTGDVTNFHIAQFSPPDPANPLADPANSFGAPLTGSTATLYANPTITQPDLEFSISNFSNLPNLNFDPAVDCVFEANFLAFSGSIVDVAPGEDYLPVPEQLANFSFDVVRPEAEVTKSLVNTTPIENGDTVTYEIVINNPGCSTMSAIPLTDTFDANILQYANATVAPDLVDNLNGLLVWNDVTTTLGDVLTGNAITITVEFTATQATPVGSPTVNQASVAGATDTNGYEAPASSSSTGVDVYEAGLSLVKTAGTVGDGEIWYVDASTAPTNVTFTYVLTNTGNTYLTDLTITDDHGTPSNSGDDVTITSVECPALAGPLAPNGSVTCTADISVSGPFPVTNTATVTGTPSNEVGSPLAGITPPSAGDDAVVDAFTPNLAFTKLAGNAPDGGVYEITSPEIVTYTYIITNTGDSYLSSMVITDDLGTPTDPVDDLVIDSGSCAGLAGPLAPLGSVICTAFISVNADVTNVAAISANPTDNLGADLPGLDDQTAQDDAIVNLIAPDLSLQKTVYLGDDNGVSCPGGELVFAPSGYVVTYCFEVSNIGDTYLDSIVITDTALSIPTSTTPILLSGTTPLAPGNTAVYYITDTIASDLINTALVSANPTDNLGADLPQYPDNPTDSDTAEVQVAPDPTVSVSKTLLPPLVTPIAVTDTITFEVVITNTGQTTLTTWSVVDDGFTTGMSLVAATPTPDSAGPPIAWNASLPALAAGDSFTITVQFLVTASGTHTNTVTVNGQDEFGRSITETVASSTVDFVDLDYGDAPDPTYPTLLVNDGAAHALVSNGPFMGACIDPETNGQPSANADGDDVNDTAIGCADDENGVTLPTQLLPGDNQAQVTVDLSNSPQACLLNAWVDFNGDGVWSAGEQIFTDEPLSLGVNNLTFAVPGDAASGTTYARFRCSTQSALGVTGRANDGEVEDYAVEIAAGVDYGDAPDQPPVLNYPTQLSSNGAGHTQVANGPFMGACVDAEPDGQAGLNADGDDANNTIPGCSNDEDGVTLPTQLLPGDNQAQVTVDLSNSPQACLLNAWIDFDGSGSWENDEQIFVDQTLSVGVNNLTFAVPGDAASGTTYARFRCSTQSGLAVDGIAPDGEVEDYVVEIAQPVDYGDAPSSYPTLLANNGARHTQTANSPFMGACVDAEPDGQPNALADGDNANDTIVGCTNDEDGVTLPTQLLPGDNQTQVTVDLSNSPQTCLLNAWVDFNSDGVWGAGEQIFTDEPLSVGVNNLTFAVPGDAVGGATYARFRCSTQSALGPDGPASDGEVEDYLVEIATPVDYGDAPDTGQGYNYATLLSNGGAAHLLVNNNPFMGACVDAEPDGQPSVGATDDDNANTISGCTDDEDGVTLPSSLIPGQLLTPVTIDLSNSPQTCLLNAWIDFNRNTRWDADEQIFSDQALSVGVNNLTFAVPADAAAGTTYARFRCSTSGGIGPDSLAADGEVEDYAVVIEPTGSIGDYVWYDANSNGVQDVSESGIANVRVRLYADDGDGNFEPGGDDALLDETYTDADGGYLFRYLVAGDYFVHVDETSPALSGLSFVSGPQSPGNPHPLISLGSGQDYRDADFGYVAEPLPGNAMVGDTVFYDGNGNGLQDAGEPGIAGVTVVVQDSGANPIGSAVTDDNGHYLIEVPAGSGYSVAPVNPSGLTPTTPQPILLPTLNDGDQYLDADFGFDSPDLGQIDGVVFDDKDNDGVYSPITDTIIPGVSVQLIRDDDGDGVWDAGEPVLASVLTNGSVDGNNNTYSFSGLPADDYLVRVSDTHNVLSSYVVGVLGAPDTDHNSQAQPYSVALPVAGIALTADFGYFQAGGGVAGDATGVIGNQVWHDVNGNGLYEPGNGESGIAGVTVELRVGASVVATTTTGASGGYVFTNLAANTYNVRVTDDAGVLTGYLVSLLGPNPGQDNNNQSQPYTITLASGAFNFTADFAYARPVTITGFTYFDVNGDGARQGGEPGVSGIPITLTNVSTGQVVSTTLSYNGPYTFANQPPGTYRLDAPSTAPGLLRTSLSPLQITVLSGGISPDNDFGYIAPTNVTLVDFTALAGTEGNVLRWQTSYENEVQGFVVFRSPTPNDGFQAISELISASGNPAGSTYEWVDTTAKPGVNYWYKLQSWPDGEFFGPVPLRDDPGEAAPQLYLPFVTR